MRRQRGKLRGFTLIELVMVILLLGILAAIAIPNFIDFRTDAKNGATQGALGAFRAAVAIAVAAIQLREDPTASTPKYPTVSEMAGNAFNGSHPALSGTNILDSGSGIPKNPWSLTTLTQADYKTIIDCNAQAKGATQANPVDNRGWCYNQVNGNIWANSFRNGAAAGNTENSF